MECSIVICPLNIFTLSNPFQQLALGLFYKSEPEIIWMFKVSIGNCQGCLEISPVSAFHVRIDADFGSVQEPEEKNM